MTNLKACLLCLATSACFAQTVQVKIIAFNDFHGNLLSPGTAATAFGQTPVKVGGADYLAAYVAWLSSMHRHHLVVSAGDVVGASPLVSAQYHDEGTIEAMNVAGLNLSSIGNHEFDGGTPELLRKQKGGCLANNKYTCLEKGKFPGAKYEYLAANVLTVGGKTLFPAYSVRRFNGVKVAFIGLVLKDTPSIVLPPDVAGLTFKDEADTVNALVPKLHAEHIHAIVLVIHQGGIPVNTPGAPDSINDCPGQLGTPQKSPILDVISRLDDAVDLVISGHSHVAYNCLVPNSKGRAIPLTQASAFGKMLTDIDMTLDRRTGHVAKIAAKNLLVSQPEADTATSPVHPFLATRRVMQVRALLKDYEAAVATLTSQVIGSIAVPLSESLLSSNEQPVGDLVEDAQLAVTSSATTGAAVASFGNASGIRASLAPAGVTYPHEITYGDAFSVRPFGNTLLTITLTAQNLKDFLEQQFAGCLGQTQDTPLEVSQGFHFEWSASGAPCSKIVNATLASESIIANGMVPNPSKSYRITVDNFLGSGGSGFKVLLQGTDPVAGQRDIDAVVSYMTSQHKAPNPPYAVEGSPRIVKLP